MEAFSRGEIPIFVINCPPRHLKSFIISICYPAWRWTRRPDLKFMCLTYGQKLSADLAKDCRRLVKSQWYQRLWGDRVQIADDQDTKLEFDTTAGGSRFSASVEGGIIGKGGEEILIDDPHDTKKPNSDTMYEAVRESFDNTILNRFNTPKDPRLCLIMQRLREDDLTAHILAKMKNAVLLCLPAEAELERRCVTVVLPSTAPLRWEDPRSVQGALLCPEYFGPAEVAFYKNQMTPHGYAGRYQQAPMAAQGDIFDIAWFNNRYNDTNKPTFFEIVMSLDTAEKTLQSSAFSVCTVWGIRNMNAYLLHVWRQKCKTNVLYDTTIELMNIWQPDTVLIEDKSSGTGLINMLRGRKVDAMGRPVRGGASIIAVQVPSKEDKEHRAESTQSFWATGRGFLPEQAPWLAEWINEHLKFPNTSFMDQVDSTSQFVKWFTKRRVLQRPQTANIVPIFQR